MFHSVIEHEPASVSSIGGTTNRSYWHPTRRPSRFHHYPVPPQCRNQESTKSRCGLQEVSLVDEPAPIVRRSCRARGRIFIIRRHDDPVRSKLESLSSERGKPPGRLWNMTCRPLRIAAVREKRETRSFDAPQLFRISIWIRHQRGSWIDFHPSNHSSSVRHRDVRSAAILHPAKPQRGPV